MMPSPDAQPVRLERPLERIGRYRIVERIGKGAMGVVFAARDDLMDRNVALKVLVADLDGEPDIRARFFREAQVAARLVHPNVVTIFDIGEEDGRLYMVMELLRGQTLADYLRDRAGRLDFEWKLDAILQVCDGLSMAAAAGVSHRDIKPGNLFVQSDGTVKILDFGIARLASSSMTASGFIVGTPDYMSPEQARGIAVDPRSDQFSVAAVLYYLLAGRKPFAAPSLPAVLHKVVSEDPAPLTAQEAPFGLSRIVTRALSKQPDARYPTIGDLAAELRKVLRRAELETHTLAGTACTKYAQLQAALTEHADIRTALTMPAEPRVCFEQVPEFLERGPDALRGAPLRIAAVRSALETIDRTLGEVEPALLTLRSQRDGLERSRALLAAGDPRSALTLAEQIFAGLPGSPLVEAHVTQCRGLVSEHQARADRVAAITAQATIERAAGRLGPALELTTDGLALAPHDTELMTLAAQIRGDIAREAAERRERLEQQLALAARALAKEKFAEADEACRRARAIDPESRALAQLAAQVASARAAHEVAQYRLRVVADKMAEARAAFEAGRETDAIATLEAVIAEHPGAAAAVQELSRMRAELERKRLAELARRNAERLTAEADAAWTAGDAAGAAQLAERALAALPNEPGALRVLGLAKARLRELADRQARAAQAVEHLARARAQIGRGRLDKALREARQAVELDPASIDAPSLVADILRRQEAEERSRAAAAEAARRAKQVKPLVTEAQAARRDGSFARAIELANHALAIDPESVQVRELIAALTAEAALARSPEDTVELVARDADPDDTQTMPRLSTAHLAVATVRGAAVRTRRRAANWLAKLRTPAGGPRK